MNVFAAGVDATRRWSRCGRTTESTPTAPTCFTQTSPVIYPNVYALLPKPVSPNPGFSASLTATGCITSLPRRHPFESAGLLPIQRHKTLDRIPSFALHKTSYSCNAQERHPVGESSPECRPAIPDEKAIFQQGLEVVVHVFCVKMLVVYACDVRKISLLHRSKQKVPCMHVSAGIRLGSAHPQATSTSEAERTLAVKFSLLFSSLQLEITSIFFSLSK